MRTDNILLGARRTNPPYVEVRPNSAGITKLATLANLWQRSWLYRSATPGFVLLAADEVDMPTNRLLAVLGPMSHREMKTFLSEELH